MWLAIPLQPLSRRTIFRWQSTAGNRLSSLGLGGSLLTTSSLLSREHPHPSRFCFADIVAFVCLYNYQWEENRTYGLQNFLAYSSTTLLKFAGQISVGCATILWGEGFWTDTRKHARNRASSTKKMCLFSWRFCLIVRSWLGYVGSCCRIIIIIMLLSLVLVLSLEKRVASASRAAKKSKILNAVNAINVALCAISAAKDNVWAEIKNAGMWRRSEALNNQF